MHIGFNRPFDDTRHRAYRRARRARPLAPRVRRPAVGGRVAWTVLLVALALPAIAGDPRGIVFDCPCRAEWAPGGPGENGELALTFGVRSFRTTESGDLRIVQFVPQTRGYYSAVTQSEAAAPFVPPVPPMTVSDRRTRTIALNRPHAGEPIGLALWERVGETPAGVRAPQAWHRHEGLVLWPAGEALGGRVRFVDILTDTDGDGVGDVNEELAGMSPADAASTPGESTVDVLALYNDGFRTALDGYPFTQIHHVMVLTDALYRDSGTNLRLRMVGVQEVELDAEGLPFREVVVEQMERHGADLAFRLHMGGNMGCSAGFAGCAVVGGTLNRGHWRGEVVHNAVCRGTSTALCAAHELGHNLGLAHSAQVGEAYGLFRWSRGHSSDQESGTIMAPGRDVLGGVFSDPGRDCEGAPCGVPVDRPDGAHAARSVDLVRFQVAAYGSSQPDTDGDGIVDPADALPEDPGDWVDLDADGIGDLADADDDGVGDNADDEVVDLSPFRDSALRAAVERELGKSPGAPISAGDLAALTGLTARLAGIWNLAGLELAENLEEIDLTGNHVADVSPLAGLAQLDTLDLSSNRIGDLSPLADLQSLVALKVMDNPISDLSPLTELPQLVELFLGGGDHGITDPSPLAELTGLGKLTARCVGISDLTLLTGMTDLWSLDVADNPIADLSPLRGMPKIYNVNVSGTAVSDLSPLSDHRLGSLNVSDSPVTLDEVAALMHSRQLLGLGASGLGIGDISVLSDFLDLNTLVLADNGISDLSPLHGLTNLGTLHLRKNDISDLGPLGDLPQLYSLDLADNAISDIGPLAGLSELSYLNLHNNEVADISALIDRNIWNLETASPNLYLNGNPLDRQSYDQHIPTLTSWGVTVHADEPPAEDSRLVVAMTDPVLRALVGQAQARWWFTVDDPITVELLGGLTRLHGYNAGVSELTGLEAASDLAHVFLGSNLVSDLGPLSALDELDGLDLANNLVSDIGPLVENRNIRRGGWVTLTGNPLSEESLNVHVPALRERGVQVAVDSVRLVVSPDSREAAFDISGYFSATLGPETQASVTSDDTGSIRAEVVDGELRVDLADSHAPSTVTVTGTGTGGAVETLDFHVSLGQVVALFPPAASPAYQGFVRVINHSARAGRVVIRATDDAARRYEPVTLAIGAGEAVHFNSQDLEYGNEDKGLFGRVGEGAGDWRLDLASNLDIEVLGYARTWDGFVTTLHELAPRAGDDRAVAIFNPGSNRAQVSRLRLVNHDDETANVAIRGVDDQGRSPGGDVSLTLAPRAARTLTAAEVESGADAAGALGDGAGKWRLVVESPQPVYAVSLLESPTGHLTNLSSGPVRPVDGTHTVPLFLPVADQNGRQGFVRVANRADRAGTVTITAIDDSGTNRGNVSLALGAGQTAHFNSEDLELGNAAKGLAGSVGTGTGNWRLGLTADVEIDVLGYVRHADGFLTSMHDAAPPAEAMPAGSNHRVGFFNPGSNLEQESLLRLINTEASSSDVVVRGIDDRSQESKGTVRLMLAAGASRSVTAAQLESGDSQIEGALGDGTGKWRLEVEADSNVRVMNLLRSPTGHLSNLSTIPPELPGAGATVHHVPLFPSASDPLGRQGFVRVINKERRSGEVRIDAYDDSGMAHGPVRLSIDAGAAVHFNSQDLESGNSGEGLTGSTGAGSGDWRLILASDLDIEVLAYARTHGGFLASMHDHAPFLGDRYRVALLNPASNYRQASLLRLVNPGDDSARIAIAGTDDSGRVRGSVSLTLGAGESRLLTASELERGGDGLGGSLGDGQGKWRLAVESDQPLLVMSLLASPTGHLTNLSTSPPSSSIE